MLQENHPSSSTANNARQGLYVISCMRFDLGPLGPDESVPGLLGYPYDDYDGAYYAHFVHEADNRLMELREAVEQGEMTAEEAYEAFRPYTHLYPEMYTPEFQEEWGNDFPQVGFEYDFMPVSEKFWHEASGMAPLGDRRGRRYSGFRVHFGGLVDFLVDYEGLATVPSPSLIPSTRVS